MYVSSRQEYKPPVKSIGKVKEYSHFASLKYCNGAETFYTVSYHAYIPLLKFNNIVMNKIIKILSSIICFFASSFMIGSIILIIFCFFYQIFQNHLYLKKSGKKYYAN